MNIDFDRYILYADDDREDQENLKELIKEIDASVGLVPVYTGTEVLEFLQSLRKGDFLPCLILLDLNMPKLDGMETLKRLRQDATFKSIPIIIFSTGSRENHVDLAKSEGARDYVQKPFSLEKFKSVINEFIDHCTIVPEQKS